MLDSIIPLSSLEEASELLEALDSLQGKKWLIIESELRGIVTRLLGGTDLRKNGVECVLELSSTATSASGFEEMLAPDELVFLVRPTLSRMKYLARFVHDFAAHGGKPKRMHRVYFVPHSSVACEQVLEDEGVLDQCEIGEINLGFAPLSSDLLTLGMARVFQECYVDGDASSLSIVAAALHKLQCQLGVVPHIKSKGAASRKVVQKMLHLRRIAMMKGANEWDRSNSSVSSTTANIHAANTSLVLGSQIDTLVVIDREIDLISPLLSPLTYEGLVDELLGIQNGAVLVNESLLGGNHGNLVDNTKPNETFGGDIPNTNTGENASEDEFIDGVGDGLVRIVVDDSDPIFAEIRNLSIQRLGPFLQEKAVENKQRHAAFRENKDASISELHDFVKKMPALTKEYKSLTQHIHIAELIKLTTDSREFREQWQGERGMLEGESYLDTIDIMIIADAEATNLYKILRLLCIQSITSGGIRSTRFDATKRMIAQTYGYEQVFVMINLERAGLLKRKDLVLVDTVPSVWQNLRKQLKLIDEREESMLGLEEHMGYVSAGYAPMSARLIQNLVTTRPAEMSQPSWRSVADIVRLMPGPTLEFTQNSTPEELDEALQRTAAAVQQIATPAAKVDDEIFNLAGGEDEHGLKKKVMLVVVVGGLSYLEIAAFRVLSRDPAFPFSIILASTVIGVGGDRFLQSMRA